MLLLIFNRMMATLAKYREYLCIDLRLEVASLRAKSVQTVWLVHHRNIFGADMDFQNGPDIDK